MKFFVLFITFVFSLHSLAEDAQKELSTDDFLCPDSKLIGTAMITDVCWKGMFPIYVFGTRLGGDSAYAPTGRSRKSICTCDGDINKGQIPRVGTVVSLKLPTFLIGTVARPYCFPELGGISFGKEFGFTSRHMIGNERTVDNDSSNDSTVLSFSWHHYAFPVAKMLEVFVAPECFGNSYSNFDMVFISETMPTWTDEKTAFLLMPESLVMTNPLALAGPIIECPVATVHEPIDSLPYAAGCWGAMCPNTKNTGHTSDKVSAKQLVALRALYLESRIGFMNSSMGDSALCKSKFMPLLQKSQFYFQRLWPMPESTGGKDLISGGKQAGTKSDLSAPEQTGNVDSRGTAEIDMNSLNRNCIHSPGATSYTWGVWRDAKQSSFSSELIYQWNDCCMGYSL